MRSIVALAATVAVAAFTLPALVNAAPSGAGACAQSGYSYSGFASHAAVSGLAATVRAVRAPDVSDGHAAAWIGVGDRRGWLQVGLAGYRGGALRLYYETRSPGVARRYVDLGRAVVGRSYLLAVAETARDVWSVSVDGREIATLTLRLNRRGVATSESWTSAGAPCNHYGFAVSAVATPSGWTRIGSANGTARSFTAAA